MEIIKKKYEEIKQKHPGCVVLFRVGDYYECYYDDADAVSSALSIELQQDGERKMAAFPFMRWTTICLCLFAMVSVWR